MLIHLGSASEFPAPAPPAAIIGAQAPAVSFVQLFAKITIDRGRSCHGVYELRTPQFQIFLPICFNCFSCKEWSITKSAAGTIFQPPLHSSNNRPSRGYQWPRAKVQFITGLPDIDIVPGFGIARNRRAKDRFNS